MWPSLALPALKEMGSPTGGAAGPSAATLGAASFGFDNSNWTVSTGSSSAGARIHPAVLAGAAVLALLIVWRLTKKS